MFLGKMYLHQPPFMSLLLGILVQFTISKAANELIFKGHDTIRYVGFSGNITCTWTGAENITKLEWYLVGLEGLGLGQHLSYHSTVLKTGRIPDVSWNGQRFKCTAITVSGTVFEKLFTLMVKEIEYKFNITEDKCTVFNCLTLTCTVWSEVPVTVEWLFENGSKVLNTSTITVSERRISGLLNEINITFKPLLLSHEGLYTCSLRYKTFIEKQSYSVAISKLWQAYPMSGSIIDINGVENITLFCEVGKDKLVQTMWQLLTNNDMLNGQKPVNVLGDERFILTGDVIVSDGVITSLNTNMTIVEVTTELEESVLFCGTADSFYLGNFTLIAKIHEKAKQICITSTTNTTAIIEVEILSQGTPPFMIVIEIIDHPELCCNNITASHRSDTVQLKMDGLSEGTVYRANLFVENQRGRGPAMQFFFTPDSSTTNSNTPDSNTPDSSTTDSNTPKSNTTDSSTPDSDTTDSNTPDSNTTDSSTTDSNTPDSNTTDSSAPDSNTTDSNTPNSDSSSFPLWLKAVIPVFCFVILAIFIIVCLLICRRYKNLLWWKEVLTEEASSTSSDT